MKPLFLLALAAVVLPAAHAGVETVAPTEHSSAFAPRGVVVEMPLLREGTSSTPGVMNLQVISTGSGWVALESDLGQAIAREMALLRQPANLRSDGTIRGRQHHPVDFPPRR